MWMEKKNIERIAAYFAAGCKSLNERRVGIETEHFVVDGQGEPATYERLERIMQEVVRPEDQVVTEDGHFLGYYNEEFSITLEPAAQLEISVMPQQNLLETERILNRFYREYGTALAEEGYHMVNMGYHPARCADELPLIPKKRYEYMNAYFAHSGTRGYQMMRATASTQVSVDYLDEADFIQKYRLACALVPIFSLITENSPIYEGKKSERFLTRSYVWQDVDPVRCLTPDCTFDKDFGFRAYAGELYRKPPILVKEGKVTRDTGKSTIAEWYQDRELTMEEIEHLISMFFPDVRLKHYLEIRPADSLPLEFAMSYVALVRGIFYQKETLGKLTEAFRIRDKQEIEKAKNQLMQRGFAATVYGRPASELVDLLFESVLNHADEETAERIKPLAKLAAKRITPAQYLSGEA